MSFQKAGISAQNPRHASALGLCLAVACCLALASCGQTLQNVGGTAAQTTAPTISIQPGLPGASVGKAYNAVLSVSGGTAPYSFLVSQGALPPGLTLNSRTGDISGSPIQAGNFEFTIQVKGSVVPSVAPRVVAKVAPNSDPGGIIAPAEVGTRAFTMAVGPCASCSDVQISPANPSVGAGGTVQFTATTSDGSNSAVTWSADAGTISSSGIFHAPATANTKTVQIVATSVAHPATEATTTVTVSGKSTSNLRIETSSIPPASSGVPYSITLAVSGGSAPYHWSLASGSLPTGLKLNATTGVISGSPAQVGTSEFTVSVSDGSSYTAQQNFALSVATSQQCGPPAYCARQDTRISQPQTPVFDMHGLTGAGTCYVPNDFGLPVCRLTDSNWDPGTVGGNTFSPVGGDNHFFSCNRNLIFFANNNALGYVAALSTSTAPPYMAISHVYPTGPDSAHGGWYSLSDSGGWSWNCAATPNLLYLRDRTKAATIDSYDFTGYASNPSGGPATATLFNFAAGSTGSWGTTSSNCLPSNANMASGWREFFGSSKMPADQTFEMAFSLVQGVALGIDTVGVTHGSTAFSVSGPTALDTSGSLAHAQIFIAGAMYAIATVAGDGRSGTLTTPYAGTTRSGLSMTIPNDQNTAMDIAIYRPGSGCAHLNTGTGVVTSDFGPSGTISTTDRFYLHGARLTPDGNYVFMSTDACVPGTCSSVNNMGYVWDTSTLTVVPLCQNPNFCGGHNTDGFTHIVNQGGAFPQSLVRSYAGNATPTQISSATLDNCARTPIDTHLSWQDVDAADSYPFIVSSVAFGPNALAPGSYNCPLMNEVFAVDPVSGTIYRFAHTLITGQNWDYVIQNGMGQVSDDGQYYMFGSDWNGTLGRYDLHPGRCVNSPAGPGACRGDVFMVNLAAVPQF